MSHSHEYFYQLSISFYCLVSIFHKAFIKNQRWLCLVFFKLFTQALLRKKPDCTVHIDARSLSSFVPKILSVLKNVHLKIKNT